MTSRKTKNDAQLEALRIFAEAVKKFCNENTGLNAADGVAAMALGMGSAAAFMMVSLNSTEDHVLDGILKLIELSARDDLTSWRSSHPHMEVEIPWKGK